MEPSSAADGREPVGPVFIRPFDKYVLVRKLAEGGMAEIFLAKQVGVDGFEKNVVIKRMLRHLSQSTEFVDMFRDEARLASQLSHPNVVQILELGFADGCYFIAMEYMAGEDFSAVIRRAARNKQYLPIPVAARVVADAAQGLHFAHEMTDEKGQPLGLVHRDVSPSNIFVSYTGQVKVLDFGIARAESRLAQTAAGTVKGKYQYMSPEQAQAEPIDRRSDVYALGVSLYEALVLRRPFARDTDLAILKAVLANEYARPRAVRPDLPEALEDIIVKALAPGVEDRFQSAAQLAAALDGYLTANRTPLATPGLGQFMKSFFGEERALERQRIPPLSELKGQPPDPVPPPMMSPPVPSVASTTPAAAGRPRTPERAATLTPPSASAYRPGRPAWLLPAGGGVALTVVGLLVFKLLSPAPAPVQPGVVAPAMVDAGTAAVAVAKSPEPLAVVDAGQPPSAVAELVDAGTPAPVRPASGVVRPVTLTGAIISSVVKRNTAAVFRCFDQFKADLPSEKGTVPVTLTVASSGKVTQASSPMGDKPVGQCIERQARAMKFPPHVDKEVTVSIPFAWQVKR